MTKLNQIVALASGKKTRAAQAITEIYHKVQKPELVSGISRTYLPKDEEGERLPPEAKNLQCRVKDFITEAVEALADMMDVIATQDVSNCQAKADVKIDGIVLLKDIPVTHLLFLEKQVTDLHTFVSKLPALDPAETWFYDQAADGYATVPSETTRTKKVPKAFVAHEATKEHPAQVQVFNEDIIVGTWRTVKFSGAIPSKEKNAMLGRCTELKESIMLAREEANNMEVHLIKDSRKLLDYVFGK